MADIVTGRESDAVLYGVARFAPDEGRMVEETVITFDSPASADLFAIERGWSDYQVTPLRFFISPVFPQAGSHLYLDAALSRAAGRNGGRR
jgi:hypothetical protein